MGGRVAGAQYSGGCAAESTTGAVWDQAGVSVCWIFFTAEPQRRQGIAKWAKADRWVDETVGKTMADFRKITASVADWSCGFDATATFQSWR